MKRSFWSDPVNWFFIAFAFLPIAGIATMIYIALHFLIKFW